MARIYGTKSADVLWGTEADDTVVGLGGNDTFHSTGGKDHFDGGEGIDTVSYRLATAAVSVNLGAGVGNDGRSLDTYASIEDVAGSQYNDFIAGNNVENELSGGGGRDTLNGHDNNDRLFGGDQDDTLNGGAGDDLLDGGAGIDTASYQGSADVVIADLSGTGFFGNFLSLDLDDADTFIDIENISGSRHTDLLAGNAGTNVLRGEDGDDMLAGFGGADVLDGGAGDDAVSYRYASAAVRVDLQSPATNTGDAADDTLIGIERVEGSRYNDTLFGDDNANRLGGDDGADTIDGRGGNDELFGGRNADTFVFDHDEAGEADIIWYFEVGVDQIDLSETPVQNFNDLLTQGDRYMEQVGNDVVIHTSGSETTVTLLDVQMQSLSAADFLF